MKTLITACFLFVTSTALAQFTPNETTMCNPMGIGTNCSNSQGQSMQITPMGNGMSMWSNSQGQSGTIMQPAPPVAFQGAFPGQPMNGFAPPVSQPRHGLQNPYSRGR